MDYKLRPTDKNQKQEYDNLFKILLLGETGVGKSSIIVRYCDDKFHNTYMSTIGVDFTIKTVYYNNRVCKFQIWDTAGQERFRSITSTYYRGASGIILVYDITDRSSFETLNRWISDIKNLCLEDIPVIIVGNKCDCVDLRQVTFTQASEYVNHCRYIYVETSAKTGLGIENIFKTLTLQLTEKQEEENITKLVLPVGTPIKKSCCSP